MYSKEVKNILLKNLSLQQVYVFANDNHYQIIAIDKIFIGKSKLEQHKLIYKTITSFIKHNQIHAVSIHTFSPEEWNNNNNKTI